MLDLKTMLPLEYRKKEKEELLSEIHKITGNEFDECLKEIYFEIHLTFKGVSFYFGEEEIIRDFVTVLVRFNNEYFGISVHVFETNAEIYGRFIKLYKGLKNE